MSSNLDRRVSALEERTARRQGDHCYHLGRLDMTNAKGLSARIAKVEARCEPASFVLWIDENGDLLPGHAPLRGSRIGRFGER